MVGTGDISLDSVYLIALFVPAAVGVLCGLSERSGRLPDTLCAVSCVAGILCYPFFTFSPGLTFELPVGSYLGAYAVSFDELGSVFISISSLVFLMVLVHMSHSGHGYTPRYTGMCCALFLAVTLCMCADSAILLLLSWEAVSMVTFLMARTDGIESARWRFLAVTHIGGLSLIHI